jgi:type IV pilus assembly protein PilW
MKARRPTAAGFTLVEMMVALLIGLVLTLVITNMLARQEAVRRNVTSGNDMSGNAAYVAYTLERELRSAGSGIGQLVPQLYGCPLAASRQGAQLLPSTAAFLPPFASVPQTYRLAPLLVHAGLGAGGSDVIAMASGASGLSELGIPVSPGTAAAGQVQLLNTLGMRGGDLLIVSQEGLGCMLQQVSPNFTGGTATVLTFSGTYAANTINGLTLSGFSKNNTFVSLLGNAVGNQPRLQLIGIGDNATLFTYDLLQLNQSRPQAVAEGIVDLRVRYGVDTVRTGQHQVTAWVAPTEAGWTAADLTTGTTAARANMQAILAVRVGLVLRSELIEKGAVNADTLTLFPDLPTAQQHTYTLPTGGNRQRYRTVEFMVPLRNARYSL